MMVCFFCIGSLPKVQASADSVADQANTFSEKEQLAVAEHLWSCVESFINENGINQEKLAEMLALPSKHEKEKNNKKDEKKRQAKTKKQQII